MRLPLFCLTTKQGRQGLLLVGALTAALGIQSCGGGAGVDSTDSISRNETAAPSALVEPVVVRSRPPSPPVTDRWPPAPVAMLGEQCSARLIGTRRTLDLGPGRTYTEAAAVPWLSLSAGDVVNIHHREQPYRVKIGIAAQGRAGAPVVINGVTDADCNRPVISGQDARIAADAADSGFFQSADTERLGTLLLNRTPGQAYGDRPAHIVLRNLEITGAHATNSYTAQDGSVRQYLPGAAGVHAVAVDNLTIENSLIHGNGNGVFVASRGATRTSSNIVLRANAIYDNGTDGSYLEHNVFVQARRALYEGNYLGQLIPGAEGSSLKDRSSGTVVRYNRIDAAASALDLTDAQGYVPGVVEDPLYPDAWVYGNSIINDLSTDARSSSSVVRWSGDDDTGNLRGGILHWYQNTLQTLGDKEQFWYIALFDAPQQGERVRVRNSVFLHEGTSEPYLVKDTGRLELAGSNYLTDGWQAARASEADVQMDPPIRIPGRAIEAGGLPVVGGPLIDAADGLELSGVATLSANSTLPIDPSVWRIDHQPALPWGLKPRKVSGDSTDLGAFEAP